MNSLSIRYRRVAVIALLVFAWSLPASVGLAASTSGKLQVLLNATVAQLQLAYRQYPDERVRRQEQLVAAIEAWRAAPRSEANNEKLANWLRAAIDKSMPGSRDSLPAIPAFGVVAKVEPLPNVHEVPEATVEPKSVKKQPQTTLPVVQKHSSAKTTASGESNPFADDPFRDDPASDD